MKQKHEAFIQAIKEFNSELDCISILKPIKELKASIKYITDSNQQEELKLIQTNSMHFGGTDKNLEEQFSKIKEDDVEEELKSIK